MNTLSVGAVKSKIGEIYTDQMAEGTHIYETQRVKSTLLEIGGKIVGDNCSNRALELQSSMAAIGNDSNVEVSPIRLVERLDEQPPYVSFSGSMSVNS